jgi:hypothetical protein
MIFKGKDEPLGIPIHHHQVSDGELKTWAETMVFSATVIVAIAADEALRRKFYGNPYDDPDFERRAVRSIMYMIRCAVAHNPVRPVWQCKSHYLQTFEIPALRIKLDCASVDGKQVHASDYGGWDKFKRLADRCLERVS